MKRWPVVFLGVLALSAIVFPFLFSEKIWVVQPELVLQAPSFENWLGTDGLGRDLMLRMLQGAQISLFVGLLSAAMALLMGTSYGAISGWFGGLCDQVLMRFLEVFTSLPQFALVGLMVMIFYPSGNLEVSVGSLFLFSASLALGSWMSFARLSRNLVLAEKAKPYVDSARVLGAPVVRIWFRHLLPNMTTPLLVFTGLQISHFLLFESLLSFVGVGVQPPASSFGLLIREGWTSLSLFPHLLLLPSALMFLTILALNALFESLRE